MACENCARLTAEVERLQKWAGYSAANVAMHPFTQALAAERDTAEAALKKAEVERLKADHETIRGARDLATARLAEMHVYGTAERLRADAAEAKLKKAEEERDRLRRLIADLVHPERQKIGHRVPQTGCICVWCEAHIAAAALEPSAALAQKGGNPTPRTNNPPTSNRP